MNTGSPPKVSEQLVRACRRLEAGPRGGVDSSLLLRNTHWVGVFSGAERGGVSTNLTSIDKAGPDHPLRLSLPGKTLAEKLATLPRARATRRAVASRTAGVDTPGRMKHRCTPVAHLPALACDMIGRPGWRGVAVQMTPYLLHSRTLPHLYGTATSRCPMAKVSCGGHARKESSPSSQVNFNKDTTLYDF